MGISIGQGLMAFGEGQKAIRDNKAKAERQASQDILKASQQEFTNNIATQTLKNQTQEINNRKESLRIAGLEKAMEVENRGKAQDANRRLFKSVTGMPTEEITGYQNENIGELDQQLPRIDIESNLKAFKSIQNPTPEINQFIADLEGQQKLGVTSVANPSDMFQEMGSEEDMKSLFNQFDSIPLDQQTPLTAGLAGATTMDRDGITDYYRPLSLQDQDDQLMKDIESEPDFFLQSQADQGKFIERARSTFVDPDAPEKLRLAAEISYANLDKTRLSNTAARNTMAEAAREVQEHLDGGREIDPGKLISQYQSNTSIKSFGKSYAAIEKVRRVANPNINPTAASDLAIVFGFMRLLDTDSVVREAEQQTARGAQEFLGDLETHGYQIPPALYKWVDSAQKGTIFGPKGSKARADFLDVAEGTFKAQATEASAYINHFSHLEKISNNIGVVVPKAHRDLIDTLFAEEESKSPSQNITTGAGTAVKVKVN